MDKINVAINGFGRIGRAAFKAAEGYLNTSMEPSKLLDTSKINVVAINDLGSTKTLSNLLKYDSVYGRLKENISFTAKEIKIKGKSYMVFSEKDPRRLPWKDLNIDVVLECTGVFTEYEKAAAHLQAGARRVLISAPGKGVGGEIQVLGTKKTEDGGFSKIVSNASCTTNCISPVIQALSLRFGVEKSLMSTVHGYTATQNIVDGPHKDLRRARAAAVNIIPTTTGAAKATTEVIPELKELFDGIALRVPVICGSISDIVAVTRRRVTVEEVNQAFKDAENESLFKGILKASNAPLVSTDVIGTPYSAIVDLPFTRVVGGNLVKVLAWYDNEWAYSCRLVELAMKVSKG